MLWKCKVRVPVTSEAGAGLTHERAKYRRIDKGIPGGGTDADSCITCRNVVSDTDMIKCRFCNG
eukprot:4683416-Karenia_brevis.AAC.1